MPDFSLAEIMLVVVVAVIFIGPKELPVVVKAIGKALRGMRSLTHEVRQAFDTLAQESGLAQTTEEINAEMRRIQGDDGKYYERYDMPQMTAKPAEKSHDDAGR